MTTQLTPSLVRIISVTGDVIGAGFLVTDRHLLTCAHVIASAFNLKEYSPDLPSSPVALDFPLLAPGNRLTGHVTVWQPPQADSGDIAVVELDAGPPPNPRPIRLVDAEDMWGHPFRACGFPANYENGVWASGVLRGPEASGWIQIEDIKTTGYRIEPGFSEIGRAHV